MTPSIWTCGRSRIRRASRSCCRNVRRNSCFQYLSLAKRLRREKDALRSRAMPTEDVMPDKTYKIVEVVGVSDEGIQEAVRNAVAKASQTLRNIDWFEVTNI